MHHQETADRFMQLAISDLRQYTAGRTRNVERGAETPALAALMVEKYGLGMAKAVALIMSASDGHRKLPDIMTTVDDLVASIDPDWKANMQRRWHAKPAGISL